MTGQQIVFILLSFVTLASALIVVVNRNLFHAALALMVSFLGVAGLYVTLDAGFLAAAQLLVYIGAISILIIFAIMMTRRLMQATEPSFNTQHVAGIVAAVATFVLLAVVVAGYWPLRADPSLPNVARVQVLPDGTPVETVLQGSVAALGRAFVSADAYVIPFELASVLLLAALVGAIVVAWPKTEDPS
jgi:NADH:ubiquinone oxidoreductase subunit 6 (subunit J)